MKEHTRLFIPGPVEVPEATLQAMASPMIGHRAPEYSELHSRVREKLRWLLSAQQARPLLFTASATGVMEAGIRNLVPRRALNLVCGAFSKRWWEVTNLCGCEGVALEVEWGQAIDPEAVRQALAAGDFDAVTLVHNETSTGVMNDLAAITKVVREVGGDDICMLVDAVTSMSAVPIDVDALDLDLCLAGSQKAFAMPPGLSVATVSERALRRAATVPGRGFYFDFLTAVKSDDKDQTPSTPAISQTYALDQSLSLMQAEGLEARYGRHRALAERTRGWAKERFALFPAEEHCSITLTVIANTLGVDIGALNRFLRGKGVVLANGYGKLKGETFRIGHMGEVRMGELDQLLGWVDEFLASL